MTKDETILFLAQQMGIETLEIRGRDHLDFHNVGVAALKAALAGAYEAGLQAARSTTVNRPRTINGAAFTSRWIGADIIVTRTSDGATALCLAEMFEQWESATPLRDCIEMVADMDRDGDVNWEASR